MSIDLPLDNMTLVDKLEAMETLWADISRKPADLPSPSWHKDILDCRRDPEWIVNRLGASQTKQGHEESVADLLQRLASVLDYVIAK